MAVFVVATIDVLQRREELILVFCGEAESGPKLGRDSFTPKFGGAVLLANEECGRMCVFEISPL